MDLDKLRFPVGKLNYSGIPNEELKKEWIKDIEDFPQNMTLAVQNLSDEQLEWKYRPEGWTIRQVVNHTADSHINSQLRFKLALTEDTPTIKPYLEARWAELPDMEEDIHVSLNLLAALHKRWVFLLKKLSPKDLQRQYIHPEHNKTFDLYFTIAMYSWHCRHHHAHILQAIKYKGQFD